MPNKRVRNVTVIVKCTFVFVLYVHNFKTCLLTKTCSERYISVKLYPRRLTCTTHCLCSEICYYKTLCDFPAVIPLIKLFRDKASLKKSLWLPMKLQQVQCSWWVKLRSIVSLKSTIRWNQTCLLQIAKADLHSDLFNRDIVVQLKSVLHLMNE